MKSVTIELSREEADMIVSALEQLRNRAFSAGETDLYDQVSIVVRKYDEAAKRLREE